MSEDWDATEGIGPDARKARKVIEDTDVPDIPSEAAAVKKLEALVGPANDHRGGIKGDVSEEHAFTLDVTDRRGYRWTGEFVNKVLTIGDQAKVGLVRAQLAGGISPVALDFDTSQILEMRAHLAVSLQKAPDWAKRLSDIREIKVLEAIYKEAVRHERRFWGDVSEDESTSAGSQ